MLQTMTPTTIRNLMLRSTLPFKVPAISDITDLLPKHASKTWGRMKFNDIKQIVVHHTALDAPLANHARFHVNSHNWPGIAYKLVVSDGVLYQTNDLLSYTTHARGANERSIGIAVNGDLSEREMLDSERYLLYAGILTLRGIWPNAEIVGHNQVSQTACPCTDMDRIRADVHALELQVLEQEEYANTISAKRAAAYAIAERIQQLYDRLEDAKWGAAARAKLEYLLPVMDVVGGEKTAEGVAHRVFGMYKESMGAGKFADEADRKILLFEPIMRERGLLL